VADDGHELAFGTFITPQNQRPEDVVALAELTERTGLDLVTFQDHPYLRDRVQAVVLAYQTGALEADG
jgi:hypothetical protein